MAEAFERKLMSDMDEALAMLRNAMPGRANVSDLMGRLSEDTVECAMIGAALEAAAQRLKMELLNHHLTHGTPLPRTGVRLADEAKDGYTLYLSRVRVS